MTDEALSGDQIPITDNIYDVGKPLKRFRNAYVGTSLSLDGSLITRANGSGKSTTVTQNTGINQNQSAVIYDFGTSTAVNLQFGVRDTLGINSNQYAVSAGYQLTASDSGRIIVLIGSGGAEVDLPATGTAGMEFMIFIGSAQNHKIGGGNSLIRGILAGFPTTTTTNSQALTTTTSLTGNTTPSVGDMFIFRYIGIGTGGWYMQSVVKDATKWTAA